MGSDQAQRSTFGGDAQAFADLVLPLADAKGKLFCKYPSEQANLSRAKLDVKEVYNHHDLLMALHEGQQNLSFQKTVTRAGLAIVVETLHEQFNLRPCDVDDYLDTTTSRIRNLCRCVSQAEKKNSNTQVGGRPSLASCRCGFGDRGPCEWQW